MTLVKKYKMVQVYHLKKQSHLNNYLNEWFLSLVLPTTEATGAEDGAVGADSAFENEYTPDSFNYTEDCIPLFKASGSQLALLSRQYSLKH